MLKLIDAAINSDERKTAATSQFFITEGEETIWCSGMLSHTFCFIFLELLQKVSYQIINLSFPEPVCTDHDSVNVIKLLTLTISCRWTADQTLQPPHHHHHHVSVVFCWVSRSSLSSQEKLSPTRYLGLLFWFWNVVSLALSRARGGDAGKRKKYINKIKKTRSVQ